MADDEEEIDGSDFIGNDDEEISIETLESRLKALQKKKEQEENRRKKEELLAKIKQTEAELSLLQTSSPSKHSVDNLDKVELEKYFKKKGVHVRHKSLEQMKCLAKSISNSKLSDFKPAITSDEERRTVHVNGKYKTFQSAHDIDIWSSDLSLVPRIEHFQTYAYILSSPDFAEDVNRLRHFRQEEGFILFKDKCVDSMKQHSLGNNFHYVKCNCLTSVVNWKSLEKLWLLVHDKDGPVSAGCSCQGNNGCCQHVIALLLTLSSFEKTNVDRKPEIENMYQKKEEEVDQMIHKSNDVSSKTAASLHKTSTTKTTFADDDSEDESSVEIWTPPPCLITDSETPKQQQRIDNQGTHVKETILNCKTEVKTNINIEKKKSDPTEEPRKDNVQGDQTDLNTVNRQNTAIPDPLAARYTAALGCQQVPQQQLGNPQLVTGLYSQQPRSQAPFYASQPVRPPQQQRMQTMGQQQQQQVFPLMYMQPSQAGGIINAYGTPMIQSNPQITQMMQSGQIMLTPQPNDFSQAVGGGYQGMPLTSHPNTTLMYQVPSTNERPPSASGMSQQSQQPLPAKQERKVNQIVDPLTAKDSMSDVITSRQTQPVKSSQRQTPVVNVEDDTIGSHGQSKLHFDELKVLLSGNTHRPASTCHSKGKPVETIRKDFTEKRKITDNTNSRKVYSRRFLLFLRQSEISQMKPANLPDIPDIIIDENELFPPPGYSGFDFTPGYVKGAGKKKNIPLQKKSEVKLEANIPQEAMSTEDVIRKVISAINMLKHGGDAKMVITIISSLSFDTEDSLVRVVSLVVDTVADDPSLTTTCCNICRVLARVKLQAEDFTGQVTLVTFSSVYRQKFEVEIDEIDSFGASTTENTKKRIEEISRFTGALARQALLKNADIHEILMKLSQSSLDSFCILLTDVWDRMEKCKSEDYIDFYCGIIDSVIHETRHPAALRYKLLQLKQRHLKGTR